MAAETNIGQKLSEEISRLITLANTVLSTKLPALACVCIDSSIKDAETNTDKIKIDVKGKEGYNDTKESLSLIEEDTTSNLFAFNSTCNNTNDFDGLTKTYIESKDKNLEKILLASSPLTCGLENDFASIKLTSEKSFSVTTKMTNVEKDNGKSTKIMLEKRFENTTSNFIEDESGFSSMSSFQEIGIPIINIIPPTPCKEICFSNESNEIEDVDDKWKDMKSLEPNNQTMKVFWV